MIEFFKYQGAGNDFILIDNRDKVFTGDKIEIAKKWCDRRFGIGSDGLIFLENGEGVDFDMDFYNPDGSQSFCGNGARCIVAFAHSLGMVKEKITFKAIDGVHQAEFLRENVKIGMKQVGSIQYIGEDHFIDTGSPHYISFCSNSDTRDILDYGKEIRFSEAYKKEGTNVNLLTEIGDHHIAIRTYERGVENETLSCGTGATACGLSYASLSKNKEGIVIVDTVGGRLKIYFEKTKTKGVFTGVWLEGPAEFVFKGMFNG